MLQTLADTVKLVLKEDITPREADVSTFRVAPLIVFTPIAVSLIVIPFAIGWAPLETGVGVLFFLAVPSISVIGVLLAGWSSRNTYATLGGVRGAAQMISYELPRTLSVVSLCILAGSLAPGTVVTEWRWWWIPLNLIGFVVYFISSIAELNRGPFDIPEAESELVAGYFADYSGIRWAIFMMAEYGGLLAASLFGAAMFFGAGLGIGGWAGILLMVVPGHRHRGNHDLGQVDVSAHAFRPTHVGRMEGAHTARTAAAPAGRGGGTVAVDERPDPRAPQVVSASNDFAAGVRGFGERWRSLLVGMKITGTRAAGPATTLKYPFEKYVVSPRWRGALQAARDPRQGRRTDLAGTLDRIQRDHRRGLALRAPSSVRRELPGERGRPRPELPHGRGPRRGGLRTRPIAQRLPGGARPDLSSPL